MVEDRFKIKWIETPKNCKECRYSDKNNKCILKRCKYPAMLGR